MPLQVSRSLLSAVVAIVTVAAPLTQAAARDPGPQPGDIYREYTKVIGKGYPGFSVVDPAARHPAAKKDAVPPMVRKIEIGDLKDAVRAELLVDRWGGHVGTAGKKIRLNGNDWISLPDVVGTPTKAECYQSQDNPIVEIPLGQLKEGENLFEATSGGQLCHDFGYGHWGTYAIIVRIYYAPSKGHASATITSPASGSVLSLDPTIKVAAKSPAGIERVDILATYNGYDENGDGRFTDAHHYYHRESDSVLGLTGHVGTSTKTPHQIRWDTKYVPDQPTGGISLVARVQDKLGVWYVTPAVKDLSLKRRGRSVEMFVCKDVPENASARANRTKGCTIDIPNLKNAKNAFVHLRTWNGVDGGHGSGSIESPMQINEWHGKIGGKDHAYTQTIVPVALSALKEGANNIAFHSDEMKEHGIEILWPGPAITIEYARK